MSEDRPGQDQYSTRNKIFCEKSVNALNYPFKSIFWPNFRYVDFDNFLRKNDTFFREKLFETNVDWSFFYTNPIFKILKSQKKKFGNLAAPVFRDFDVL